MKAFPARYHTLCIPCGEDIKRGESIRMHPQSGAVHEECWDNVGKVVQDDEDGSDPFGPGRVSPASVLPRGKAAKDRCHKCFLIHSPGQDGCE